MSEQDELTLSQRIRECIGNAQLRMVERKAKLGESVVIADINGNPMVISASDALKFFVKDN